MEEYLDRLLLTLQRATRARSGRHSRRSRRICTTLWPQELAAGMSQADAETAAVAGWDRCRR